MPIIEAKFKNKPIQPMRTIVLSFFSIICIGTVLLMLPISSRSGDFTPITDSFFTATSATCVTGLIIYDTYTHWNAFGQVLILIMIQIGGLGLVTFTTFFNLAIGKKLGLRTMQVASESVNSNGFNDVKQLISVIIKMSLACELAGALILMITFIPKYGLYGIFISVFLAISAFCNAGFDILGFEQQFSSLVNYNDNPIVMGTIMALIICGGLGFVVWHDIAVYRRTKRLMLHTKVVLISTAFLIFFGTIGILILEWSNTKTIGNMSIYDKIINSLFQSVTFRTAGFNTIDIGEMHSLTKIFGILLMFIGAAPGSTGGGVKVTTFTVILMTVICVMRNRPETTIFGRKIDKDIVYKALSIICLAALAVTITSITLVYANIPAGISGIDSVFESVSAFGTVGVSVGPTASANIISKILLSITMFLGRVGPVSLALAVTMNSENRSKNQIIPEGKIIVG